MFYIYLSAGTLAAAILLVGYGAWAFPAVVPRSHPFGDSQHCDGCDEADGLTRHENGGWYCRRCSDEVSAAFGITRAKS